MSLCNTEDWLYYHYARRDEYLEWCNKNHQSPHPNGGQGLTLRECSQLAGVSAQSILNWLRSHNIRVRDKAEAQIGDYNHRRTAGISNDVKRQLRDRFFEQYRSGEINIIVGNRRFSNGVELDKEETTNRRVLRKIKKSQLCN